MIGLLFGAAALAAVSVFSFRVGREISRQAPEFQASGVKTLDDAVNVFAALFPYAAGCLLCYGVAAAAAGTMVAIIVKITMK